MLGDGGHRLAVINEARVAANVATEVVLGGHGQLHLDAATVAVLHDLRGSLDSGLLRADNAVGQTATSSFLATLILLAVRRVALHGKTSLVDVNKGLLYISIKFAKCQYSYSAFFLRRRGRRRFFFGASSAPDCCWGVSAVCFGG